MNRFRTLAVIVVIASTAFAADDWKPEIDPELIPTGMFEIDPSLEGIVRAIAEPSAEIALGYNGIEVMLEDGGIIHGIAFNNVDFDRKNSPPLVIQSVGGITQLVPKERIKKRSPLKRSLMYDPATLGLKAQDIADIAAWLQGYR